MTQRRLKISGTVQYLPEKAVMAAKAPEKALENANMALETVTLYYIGKRQAYPI